MADAGPEREILERLCAAFGIAAAYHDIWGTRHQASDADLRALLAEFGLDVGTPESIAEADRAASAAAWRAALPPVAAIDAGAERWSLPLRLPESARSLRWTVVEEDGARHSGEADASALPAVSRAEIGGVACCERRMELFLALPAGYHRLSIDGLPGLDGGGS